MSHPGNPSGKREIGRGLNMIGKDFGNMSEDEKISFLRKSKALSFTHRKKGDPVHSPSFLLENDSNKFSTNPSLIFYSE